MTSTSTDTKCEPGSGVANWLVDGCGSVNPNTVNRKSPLGRRSGQLCTNSHWAAQFPMALPRSVMSRVSSVTT